MTVSQLNTLFRKCDLTWSIKNYFLDNSSIFPFGVNNGDTLAPPGDDAASDVTILNEPITFFGSQYREIIVSAFSALIFVFPCFF